MKSLNDLSNNFVGTGIEIFTTEVRTHIEKDGFHIENNDSYNKELLGVNVYKKYMGNIGGFSVSVYIGANGIAVDEDYDCGGNSGTRFFEFPHRDYDTEKIFEETYGEMVDYINELQK